jgi:hypothetical protein
MADRKETRHAPACPSCGQPVSSGFKVNEKVKMTLAVVLIGYVITSALLFGLSLPPEMRRHGRQAVEWDAWMQPLSREPVFQIVVGIGVALGALIFYWDFFYDIYENWQAKRKETVNEPKRAYRYKCRACGREWN